MTLIKVELKKVSAKHSTDIAGAPVYCACQKSAPVYLKMRGLCPDSMIDRYWVPQNGNEREDPLYYVGFTSSRMMFNPGDNNWEMTVPKYPVSLSGVSGATQDSILLGRSNWIVENDGKVLVNIKIQSVLK